MIDLHCHVLPGIDDGPATIEESVALARTAASAGIKTIVATPHVNWSYPNEPERIKQLAQQLNERLASENIQLNVLPGAEIAMTKVSDIHPDRLFDFALGTGNWLLIEPPFAAAAPTFGSTVLDLMQRGHNVLIAHPERCAALHRHPETLVALVQAGALTSVTAGSLTGRFGPQARRFAQRLLDEEIVHNVASDAHDTSSRPPQLAQEAARAGLGCLIEWLTISVPGAILAGNPIPPRPAPSHQIRSRASPWKRLLGK